MAENDLKSTSDSILAFARSAGPWLDRRWVLFAPLCGVILAFSLNQLGVIPTCPEDKEGLTIQWWKIGSFAVLPVATFVIWLISTQLYLRTGHGAKIGLAYDGPKINLADWSRTKQVLKDLFADGQIRNKISLRFVPMRVTQAKATGQRYMKRYGFVILLVTETPVGRNGEKSPDHFSLAISTKKDAEPYLRASLQNAMAIWASRARTKAPTLQDYRSVRARNLHDLLLLFLATHYFANEEYHDASTLLRVVDDNLKAHLRADQPPRFNIREFDVQCCTRPLFFPVSEVPGRDVLEERIAFAERAMCYFKEFAGVYISLSRAKFLLGDVEGAIRLTDSIREEVQKLRESRVPPAKSALMNIYLNRGFLEFIQGRWQNAHDGYMAMLALDEHEKADWKTLIDFIDYVRNLDHFQGISFLQVLYRSIARQSIPGILREEAKSWLNEDASRNSLRALLKAASGRKSTPKMPARQPKKKGLKRNSRPR